MQTHPNLKIISGQIIDGAGGAPIPNGAVVVMGEEIVWVGSASVLPAEYDTPDALRLGEPGFTVMPGLIDGHIHIAFGEARAEEEVALYTPVEYRALKAAWFARKVLRAGVTSAFDAATTFNVAASVRNAIDADMVEGPRMAVCGRQITTHQGLEDAFPSSMPWPPGQAGVLVKSRDEIVEAIRLQIKDGVDCIKVSGSSDAPNTVDPIDGVAFTQEEFTLIATETHRLQRKCAVHARSRDAVLFAARAGFDYIMHASFIDDEGIDLCLENKATIIPTLTLLANAIDPSSGRQAGANYYRREFESAGENLRRAYAAGIPFVTGSESGWSTVPYGEWHAREMEIFVHHLGLSASQAIAAGTSVAARMLPKWQNRIGVLAAGKLADILLIDGDPLADISVLQRPSHRKAVLKGGRMIDIHSPLPERKIWSFEKSQTYLQGWYRYDETARSGYLQT